MLLNKKLAVIGIKVKTVTLLVVGLSIAAIAPSAKAAFTATFTQVGPDVLETGSGTIDTAAFSPFRDESFFAFVFPSQDKNLGGPTSGMVSSLSGTISGPALFGNGNGGEPSSGTGDIVGLDSLTFFEVPAGYTSGAPLLDTDTYSGQSLSSLGITPGTYTYTFGSGATADSYTIIAAVPEPSAIGLIAVGAVMLGLVMRTPRKQVSI